MRPYVVKNKILDCSCNELLSARLGRYHQLKGVSSYTGDRPGQREQGTDRKRKLEPGYESDIRAQLGGEKKRMPLKAIYGQGQEKNRCGNADNSER